MKFGKFLVVFVLPVCALLAGCRDSAYGGAQASTGVASSCVGCHQGKRSFSGRDAQELAEAIRAIRDGKVRHPALGLPDDSDAAIDAVAEELASN